MATEYKSLLKALVILAVFLILLAVLYTPSAQVFSSQYVTVNLLGAGPGGAGNDSETVLEVAAPPMTAAPLAADGESTCSDRATARGPGQRVVSFSFYGSVKRYFGGIEGNAGGVGRFYPGWTMRVYHETPASDFVWQNLSTLLEQYPHLDLCNISDLPAHKSIHGSQQNAWRFLPMGDPLVDVFVSRDLDARPTLREEAAVAEWLASNLTFHLMRDHPWHGVQILAGMWGTKVADNRTLHNELWSRVLKAGSKAGKKGKDQSILKSVVWPVMKGNVMQHDSYFCASGNFKKAGHMRPFPVRRLNEGFNFIGFTANSSRDTKPLMKKCPANCRPADHKDWITC